MSEIMSNVNWIAVVVGTVASFLVGWLWYSPKLFGTRWAQGAKVELADADAMPVSALLTQLLATFFLSLVVGVFVATNATPTLMLVTLTVVLLMVSGGMFSQKTNYTIATEAGFVVVMVVIMTLCQKIL